MIMTRMKNYTIFCEVNTVGTLLQYLETKLAVSKFLSFQKRMKYYSYSSCFRKTRLIFLKFNLLLTEVKAGLDKTHFNLLSFVFVLTSPTSLQRRDAVTEHSSSLLFCAYTKLPFSLKVISGKNNLKYSVRINLLTQDSNIIGLLS